MAAATKFPTMEGTISMDKALVPDISDLATDRAAVIAVVATAEVATAAVAATAAGLTVNGEITRSRSF
jgi:hypothetical protein